LAEFKESVWLEVFVIILTVAAVTLGWLAYQGRRRAARLRELSRSELARISGEHEKRVARLQRKVDAANSLGHLDFAGDLLPVLDALGIALEESRRSEGDGAKDRVEALRDGLELVARELDAVLERHGIRRCLPEAGAPFDPNRHEAVAVVDADGESEGGESEGDESEGDESEGDESEGGNKAMPRIEPGHVVECFRPGYVHGERVLRPAAVSVAAQPK
jgi:molecular chaperone GrpE